MQVGGATSSFTHFPVEAAVVGSQDRKSVLMPSEQGGVMLAWHLNETAFRTNAQELTPSAMSMRAERP